MSDNEMVCSVKHAPMLDNRFRQLLHPQKRIVGTYVKQGDIVLDLGCGPGSFTDSLALAVGNKGHVIAVDLQRGMLDIMEKKVAQFGLTKRVTSHLCQSDSFVLEEYKEKFNFALAFWMIHETSDVNRSLKEIYQSLKLGGTLLCVEPKMHVSEKICQEMIEVGESIGFVTKPVKGIRLSRAVLFTK